MPTFYNEFDPFAAQWLRRLAIAGHITKGIVDERSIADVQPSDLAGYTRVHLFAGLGGWDVALQLAGWPTDAPVWTGSCPCQPFSCAGKRGGEADERHLWPQMFQLIEACRPPVVMGEQVASKDGLRWLDGVYADLEGAGYAVWACDTCAAGVGAPHIRQRLYWVAHANECQRRQERPQNRGGPGGLAERARRDAEAGGLVQSNGAGPQQGSAAAEADGYGSAAEPAGGGLDGLGSPSHEGLEGRPPVRSGGDQWTPWSSSLAIPCRDGKLRRISAQPGIFRMVDGLPVHLGRLQSGLCGVDTSTEYDSNRGQIDAETTDARPDEDVQVLRGNDEPQEVQRGTGGPCGIQDASLLRPPVHESRDGGHDQGAERQELPPAVAQAGEECLRGVRGNRPTVARPPQGREWTEQRREQFDYVVCALPSSLALAQLHGYGPEAEALSALQEAIVSHRTVHQASATSEEIWRSLSDEEKDAIGIRLSSGTCVIIPREPLAHGIPRDVGRVFPRLAGMARSARRNRVGRLRGYGNSIVPEVAAEFIRAYMEREL